MAYVLNQLAAGSYDLLIDSVVVGSVVRDELPDGHRAKWRAVLLDDSPAAPRPHPFTEIEHQFGSLTAVTQWLESANIVQRQIRRAR